jgi:DNA-binding transcriptional LysR family regulator
MNNRELIQLRAFAKVASLRSFARAAERLGTSRPAISRTVIELEERLSARLLNRTTRSVSLTEAGTRLFDEVQPALDAMEAALAHAASISNEPAGHLRLNAGSLAARELLAPLLPSFLLRHPGISMEVVSEDRLVDMVAAGFDAGIRLGEVVERDMAAVPIGPDLRMRIVASRDYLEMHGTPRHPSDLMSHRCLNLRTPTSGLPYRWPLARGRKRLEMEVAGPLVSDSPDILVKAASAGLGLAYLFEMDVMAALACGDLVAVLDDWTPAFPGFRIYFPSRRGVAPPLRALLDFVAEKRPMLSVACASGPAGL